MVLQGACFPQDQTCPFAPLRDLMRANFADPLGELAPFARTSCTHCWIYCRRLPRYSRPPPTSSSRSGACSWWFAQLILRDAAQRPLVFIIEDLHWSDPVSLDFLLFLARQAASMPVLLIGTYRGDEVGPALRHYLMQLDRTRLAHELVLAPLTPAEVEMMISAHLRPAPPDPRRVCEYALYAQRPKATHFSSKSCSRLVGSGW